MAAAQQDEFHFPDEAGGDIEADKSKAQSPARKDDDEIEVQIVDDTPDKDKGRKPLEREVLDPTEEELEQYSEGVKKRIAELTHAKHDARRAKEEGDRERAELHRLAQQLLQENNTLKQTVTTGRDTLLGSFREKATADLERARADLKAAHEAFDTDKIVAAQEAMQDAKIRLDKAANFRPASLQPAKTELQPQQLQQPEVKPDEKALRWQAKNQWFGQPGYEDITSYALGLHQKLVASGLDSRSDEYYEQLDARVKPKFPELFGDEGKPKPGEVQRKPASVAAPAARSSGAKKTIQLTKTQVALAQKFGLTPQQYAAQVAKLENQNG